MADFRLTKIAQFVQVGEFIPGSPGTAKPWGERLLATMAFKGSPNIVQTTLTSRCTYAPSGAPIDSAAAAGLPVTRALPDFVAGILPASCGGNINPPATHTYSTAADGKLVYFQPFYNSASVFKDGLYYKGHVRTGFSFIALPQPGGVTILVQEYELWGYFQVVGTPAVAPVYPTFQEVGNLQWNAGGQTIASASGDFIASAVVPADTAAAAVGVARDGTNTALTDQRYGALVQLGRVDAIRNGVVVANITTSRNAADPVTISRYNGQMIARVGAQEYVWPTAETGVFFLDVSLYRSGDYVQEPVMSPITFAEPEVAVVPLVAKFVSNPTVTGVTARMEIFAGFRRRATAIIPLVTTVDTRFNFSTGSFEAIVPLVTTVNTAQGVNATMNITGFASQQQAGGVAKSLAPMTLSANVGDTAFILSGASGGMSLFLASELHPLYDATVDQSIGPAIMMSTSFEDGQDFISGGANRSLNEMTFAGGNLFFGTSDYYLTDNTHIVDEYLVNVDAFAEFGEVFDFSFYVEATLSFSESWQDNLNFQTSQTFSGSIAAAWSELVRIRDGSPDGLVKDPTAIGATGLEFEDLTNLSLQTAVVEQTGAATHYSDFDYTHYARAGGESYAVKDGKLYRVGQCDAGTVPFVYVDFGESDLGVTQAKRVESLYLGVDTDGTMYAKLVGDEKERVYKVIEQRQIARVRTGKGIAARKWGLALVIQDPTQVDISNVEFIMRVSTRRWVR